MKNRNSSPFFVGYLDMPNALKKFYVPLTLAMMVFSALMGYIFASQQSSIADASWQTDSTVTFTGLLTVDPYPVLHRIHPQESDEIESVLLVRQGKFSAEEFAASLDGQMVSITGFPISRGGWTMLELRSAGDIVAADEDQSDHATAIRAKVEAVSLGDVTLAGEIADSKCFLGVMKPGEGTVHKACAEVCLLGGIPTMLVVRDQRDIRYGYILTLPDGGSASKLLSERAADDVEIHGELMQKGDLLYLRMSSDSIRNEQLTSI